MDATPELGSPTHPLQGTTFAFAIVAAEGETLSGRRSREGEGVHVGLLKALSRGGRPARGRGAETWRHGKVLVQRSARSVQPLARKRCCNVLRCRAPAAVA
jgi:hypothetical protein